MIRIVLGLFFFIPVIVSAQTKQVVLVSIDGLRPDFFTDVNYPVPHLRKLKADGSLAREMKSVFPAYTYPAHAAMLTGALPYKTGIYYNAPIGSKGEWHWFSKDIQAKTIWQALKEAMLNTAAIQFPLTVTDDITYNIPEIWNPAAPEDRITESRKYATKGLIEEIEKFSTGKLDSNNMSETGMGLDDNAGRMAAYIFRTYKPSFLAVHFAGVDGKQHEHGRNHDEVLMALQNVDHAIGIILEAVEKSGLKESTTIIIAGDHGFSDIHTILRPNVILKNANLSDHVKFVSAGGSCFLYGDLSYSVKAQTILMNSELASYFNVLDKATLKAMGADPKALLALAAKPGYVFSSSVTGKLTDTTKGGHHGYDPNLPEMKTGFIASGAGIKKGVIVPELCVTDIAPLIAVLLNIPFTAPDGKIPTAILKQKNEP